MVVIEESKTGFMEEDDVPFMEELAEEESTQEMKNQEPELSPEEEEEVIKTLTEQNMLKKIQMELDQHDKAGKEGYVAGRYNYAYSEYKTGLKALSDLIVGREARDDPALLAGYKIRRRKFCVNAAAACIKIRHWAQGLEACTLVLDEGPDDDAQRRKALFRAGVCARGMGELDAARNFLNMLLAEGGDDLDEKTRRDVQKQLRAVADEKKRYRKFAREMCSEKNAESIIFPEKRDEASGKSPEELEKLAEVEEKRESYLASKRAQKEIDERKRMGNDKGSPTSSTLAVIPPEVVISEEECISILDTLAERYAAVEVQEALKQASLDHNLKFNKGYIIRSKQILGPLQRDIFEKYGFWDEGPASGDDAATPEAKDANAKAHDRALRKLQHSIRYLVKDSEVIASKMALCQRLAIGDVIMDQTDD